MARAPREHRLETRDARLKLTARGEPYWRQILPGTFLGYRKGKRGAAWIARQRVADGYQEQRIGTPDDAGEPDGDVVLSYGQAIARAQISQQEQRSPAPRHYADGLTLNDVFEDYISQRQITPGGRFKRVISESSAKMARQGWARHGAKGIGKKLVSALDAKSIRAWHAEIATKPTTVRGKVQPFDKTDPEQVRSRRASANRILTNLKAALSWARSHDALPADMPDWWRNVAPFGLGDDPIPRMLDHDEITRLLNAAPADLRTLLTGALMTGCRYGELRSMKVGNYDPDNETVRVYQSKTFKEFRQPLTAEGVTLFERLTVGRRRDEPMFTRADGLPWAKDGIARTMRATATAANLLDVSFKATRATYGKLLLVATKDIELVAKALGHSDSRITRKHYAQLLPSEVKAGIDKLPALGIAIDSNVSSINKPRGEIDNNPRATSRGG